MRRLHNLVEMGDRQYGQTVLDDTLVVVRQADKGGVIGK